MRSIQLAGEHGNAGRQIVANTLDIALAPDGTTPTALTGRQGVQLTLPAEAGAARPDDRVGEPRREGRAGPRTDARAVHRQRATIARRAPSVDRAAKSTSLDVGLKPGMSDDRRREFYRQRAVRGRLMAATAAAARYDLDKGTLELSGTEPAHAAARASTSRSPSMRRASTSRSPARRSRPSGNVKSVLQPPKKRSERRTMRSCRRC